MMTVVQPQSEMRKNNIIYCFSSQCVWLRRWQKREDAPLGASSIVNGYTIEKILLVILVEIQGLVTYSQDET